MRRLTAAVALLLLAACSPGEEGAEIACEEFIERRVGAAVEFDDQHTVEERGGGWYVRSRADAGEGVFTWECVVSHDNDTWTLEDLTTDR